MKNSKIIKNLITIAAAAVFFLLCSKVLSFLLLDDTESYTRVMMHQLHHPEQNIDVLFVGSSHVYRSLIPEITDESFGAYTFNAGTSSQKLDGSYALIREAAADNDLQHVYLELYYGVANETDKESRTEMRSTYIISDYMKPTLRKLRYLIEASPKEYLINSFIPPRRNWTGLFDPAAMYSLAVKKCSTEYHNYEWIAPENTDEFYIDRGFVGNEGSADPEDLWNSMAYNPVTVRDSIGRGDLWYGSLERIVRFCRNRNIELTFFIAPEQEATVVGRGNYQEYHALIASLAAEYQVPFYDFNLCRPEYFDANDKSLFKDEDHLNTRGAEIFSWLTGEFFSGKISENDLFYDTYTDKITTNSISFYGISGPSEPSEDGLLNCRIISGTDVAEFRITAIAENGQETLIQDYSANREFTLPENEHGTLHILYRVPWNKPESVNITY